MARVIKTTTFPRNHYGKGERYSTLKVFSDGSRERRFVFKGHTEKIHYSSKAPYSVKHSKTKNVRKTVKRKGRRVRRY